LIERARDGDRPSLEALWNHVYAELQSLARREFASERKSHTLQPTALVNEAYLRLVGNGQVPWQNRAHFFGAAAQAMRRVLVDHARARAAGKRAGQHATRLETDAQVADEQGVDVVALHEALERLARLDPRKARVVELRFFAGLGVREIADILGVAIGTVSGDWRVAKMWLHREMT
jgi:RNA polymerase sigma-70 factor (ECF subfamily)